MVEIAHGWNAPLEVFLKEYRKLPDFLGSQVFLLMTGR
jgi:hypothetical protein